MYYKPDTSKYTWYAINNDTDVYQVPGIFLSGAWVPAKPAGTHAEPLIIDIIMLKKTKYQYAGSAPGTYLYTRYRGGKDVPGTAVVAVVPTHTYNTVY